MLPCVMIYSGCVYKCEYVCACLFVTKTGSSKCVLFCVGELVEEDAGMCCSKKSLCIPYALCVRLARTMYIRCIYGIFGREITKDTVIYGVYIRFWPTLSIWCLVLLRGQQAHSLEKSDKMYDH
jgi:hypothetical protein